MPGRFPLIAVPVSDDPFCADSFGGGGGGGGGFVPDLAQPTALIWVVYIRSILEVIEGNLLDATCIPPGPNPTLPVIVRPVVLGDNPHRFQLISSPVGNYGLMRVDANGDFRYVVDLENPIVRNLSPYYVPFNASVSDRFKFIMYDGSGDQSEGEIQVAIRASYVRIAEAFTFDPIPPVPPNQGRKMWHLNMELISTLAEPNYIFFGLNYPWSGGVESPPPYIAGYTDGAGNWLIGEPPPSGFFD
jgi:VCBS repeat-containing protein